ncbi:MAG TPA: exodeoxyribonuclease VII large subunit [Steroidobacteraceae bacterium]|nr:exodeoxyribonuclease VII large subunit [Steroidobacteraceae bacterium]
MAHPDPELDFSEPRSPPPPAETRDIYTPSRLNREARVLLERGLPALWLEGEISNLSRPSSGHWYFSLKDEAAQLRCAMFRQRNILAKFTPRDGSHVLVRGRVSLYEQRGDYQFIADYMEEAGEGALRQRFELLKGKLAAEGLFAPAHKRPLPRLPRRIGVVTSPTGAAIRDVLHILKRRFCGIPVLLYPVQVQGGIAAAQIARTIRRASARAECDVLIVVRGGGSLEDLWAFNEESVARAIYDSAIPIVTGIGHEVDFTIADFVADVRAPTPSGAAELVVPDSGEWLRNVVRLAGRLTTALGRKLKTQQDRASWLARRLQQLHPGVELRQRAQRLDDLEQRLIRVLRSNLGERQRTLAQLAAELRQNSPALRVANARRRLEIASATIDRIAHLTIEQQRNRLAIAVRTLDAFSPLATLERGYAIVTDSKGAVITNAKDVRAGQLIDARLTQGTIRARIERMTNPELDLRLPKADDK